MCPQCCELVSDLIRHHAVDLVIGCSTDTLDSENNLNKKCSPFFFLYFFLFA